MLLLHITEFQQEFKRKQSKTMLSISLFMVWITTVLSQVAPPVSPIYNLSETDSLFVTKAPNYVETLEQMKTRKVIETAEYVCYTQAAHHAHSKNSVLQYHINDVNLTEWESDKSYLPGTTFWINEYLHVGHVHYEIALVAVAQAIKLDRIVIQRAACHGTLCVGIGSFDSFYKGFFAALLLAGGQIDVPIYIRFEAKKGVIPMHLTTTPSTDYYNETMMKTTWSRSIELFNRMHFQHVIRRTNNQYGAVGTVSSTAVYNFKKAAYSLIPCNPPLTTYFENGPPYRILVAYRGGQASRQIQNMKEYEEMLRLSFPSPDYIIRMFDTSDPMLTFAIQLQAVSESHIVISNHGAFEGNMIYMKNSSLLIELFGNYGNNEIHTFQRLAIMFGIYYARLHSLLLVDHQEKYYNLSSIDLHNIKTTIQDYFDRKPYLLNLKTTE